MKTNFLVLLLILSSLHLSSAFAGQIIAQYEFGENIEGHNAQEVFKKFRVSLSDDQTLVLSPSVVYVTHPGEREIHSKRKVKQLSLLAFQNLFKDVVSLSNADIQQSQTPVVCEIMVFPAQMVDHLKVARHYSEDRGFSEELELIDGPSGCWVNHHTHPQEDILAHTALELKKMLKILALSF